MAMKFSLSSLFGGNDDDGNEPRAAPADETAPGTQIHYDASLIKRFEGHHKVLVDLIGKVRVSAAEGQYEETAKLVRKFKLMLNEHLLEENLRLYTYLTYCLRDDDEGSELMRDMRKEMGDIGRKVTRFIRHYEEHGIDARNAEKFIAELDVITEALGDRIAREERSLYTLYMPPSQIGTA